MITAVIIEDEINNANYLKGLIQEHTPEIKLLGIAMSLSEGISLVRKTNPSLIFLDVELQNENGFDLLNQIQRKDISVVFTTAHERYALRAIKLAALDYLLKPIDPVDLIAAIKKVNNNLNRSSPENGLNLFLENLRTMSTQKKIAIAAATSTVVVEIRNIIYMKAEGPYTHIFMRNGDRIMSSRHLKEYEEFLTDFNFFRIHRSFFVNLSEIAQYAKTDGGYVIMSTGDRVDVSDKKRAELLNELSTEIIFLK
ncbi:LytR/AlgR family response regulator transcription factor [Aurantibacillus circumpalustris]|uniref:LytR/AlgR family response regulator transcription factor n=1 Tax=Aurantibacillus circumpalustris TaxID=3036359 RepID=UPI00295AA265|nr:LytTR family DNA-binding domain-containing protein [Aurantibacillus circumpalustris]